MPQTLRESCDACGCGRGRGCISSLPSSSVPVPQKYLLPQTASWELELAEKASSLYVVGGGEENNAATRAKHSFEQNAIAIGSAATVIGNRYNNEQNVDSPVH
jgi:hypothetical protein